VIRVSQVRILWHPPLVTPMNASRVIEPPGFASPGTLTGVLEGLIMRIDEGKGWVWPFKR